MGEKQLPLETASKEALPQRSLRFPLEQEGEEKNSDFETKRNFANTDNEFLRISRGGGGWEMGSENGCIGPFGLNARNKELTSDPGLLV